VTFSKYFFSRKSKSMDTEAIINVCVVCILFGLLVWALYDYAMFNERRLRSGYYEGGAEPEEGNKHM